MRERSLVAPGWLLGFIVTFVFHRWWGMPVPLALIGASAWATLGALAYRESRR